MTTRKQDLFISKTLSWLLRHAATKQGLNISSDGYVSVAEILNHKSLKGKCCLEDIKRVVNNNDKQRFTLCLVKDTLYLKANQGHSLNVAELQLEPVTLTSNLDFNVIHGTYLKFWKNIRNIGLSRMSRNHLHFATALPDDKEVLSGIRNSCQIFIYINLKKALSEGINFYKSVNGVILSPGDVNGFIKPKYFSKVEGADGKLINITN